MTRFLRAAALTTLVAASVTGCASPVVMGGSPGEICLPARAGESIVYGEVATLAAGADSRTLAGAELVDAEGIEVVEAVAVPMTDGTAIASMSLDEPDAVWERRVPLDGAVLGDEPVNVAVELRRTAEPSTARALRILYRDGPVVRSTEGTTTILLADSCF